MEGEFKIGLNLYQRTRKLAFQKLKHPIVIFGTTCTGKAGADCGDFEGYARGIDRGASRLLNRGERRWKTDTGWI
jgi:hypothetical protein